MRRIRSLHTIVAVAICIVASSAPLSAQRVADARAGIAPLMRPLDRPDSQPVARPVDRELYVFGGMLVGGTVLGGLAYRAGTRCQDCMFTDAYVAAAVVVGVVGGGLAGFVVSEIVRETRGPTKPAPADR